MSRFEPADDAAFKAELWRFLLLRTIHDLGNSTSGILALSTHHLRHESPIDEVNESFRLIRESAESARQMLITVGSLAAEEGQGPELVSVPEFLTDLLGQMARIVPRSVSLYLDVEPSDAVIQVDPCNLRQAFVALIAADCLSFGARSGTVRLGAEADSGKIWILYSANHKPDFDIGSHVSSVFGKVNPPPDDLAWSEADKELSLRIGYLAVMDLTAGVESRMDEKRLA
jgi:hypothetical protein